MPEWYYLEPFQFCLLRDWILGRDLTEGDPAIGKRFDVYSRHLIAKTKNIYDPLNPNPEEVAVMAGIWRDMFREVYHVDPLPWTPRKT